MTSQQDTDRLKKSLDKLYNIKGDCDPEIAQALGTLRQLINEEFVHTNTQITTQNLYDVLYPKLTSWKDKEVTKTDVRTLETVCMLLNGDDNQLEVVRNYARNKLKMYNERKKSLQSQGGKMVQIKESKGE